MGSGYLEEDGDEVYDQDNEQEDNEDHPLEN